MRWALDAPSHQGSCSCQEGKNSPPAVLATTRLRPAKAGFPADLPFVALSGLLQAHPPISYIFCRQTSAGSVGE